MNNFNAARKTLADGRPTQLRGTADVLRARAGFAGGGTSLCRTSMPASTHCLASHLTKNKKR
ncbi:hypothetical protein [Microbulbifer donghaiensis]|uniref:hypothetical protein n=1 Tax=Microbulbifer donghaiensis TaxID=494016 RepID=UPI00116131BD|nr:hypothetical protein [Microbulbifer donghaiensis]